MSYTIVDDRTVFSENDSVGGYEEQTTSYYDGLEFGGRSGVGFVGYDIDIETLHNFETGITIPLDMTGQHFGAWLRITNSGGLDTKANGGIRLAFRDTSGNESYFFVGGIDTYGGGWYYFVCDLSGVPDSNNGANADYTNALYLGVGGKFLAKSADDNFQMDLMHYGLGGLTVTGTPDTATYGTGKSLNEIYDLVNIGNYGGISKQVKSFVSKLPITIDTTTFDDENSTMYFEDYPVSDTFYKLDLGITSGNDVSFKGFTIGTDGLTACELDLSANVTSLIFNDSTSLDQGITTFKSGDYSGDKFVNSAGIQANNGVNLDSFTAQITGLINLVGTATLKNSDIYKSTGTEAVKCVDLARVSADTFTSDGTGYAVDLITEIVADITMPWDNKVLDYVAGVSGTNVGVTPTGNEAILVNVASGKKITINVADGASTPSVANVGLGTVDIVSGLLTIAIKIIDEDLNPIISSGVKVVATETSGTITAGDILFQGRTDSLGECSFTMSYEGSWGDGLAIETTARQKSYPPVKRTGVAIGAITSTGYSTTITLLGDT